MSAFDDRISVMENFSTLDFHPYISCIVFYGGCILKCPYCYNPDLVHDNVKHIKGEDVRNFLIKRKGLLQGVVFCGGECTLQREKLIEDLTYCKSLDYKTKIDTNGIMPDILNEAIDKKIVDYVALDYKAPKNKINLFTNNKNYFERFEKSLKLLIDSKINFEVRTTVHTKITTEEDINNIIQYLEEIGYKGYYYIQFYFPVEKTLGDIGDMETPLNLSLIKETENIKIKYRNIEGNKIN